MQFQDYKDAPDLNRMLRTVLYFLIRLKNNVRFKQSYKKTKKYYCQIYISLSHIIGYYTQGNITASLLELNNFLKGWEDIPDKSNRIKKGTTLYRMRTSEGYKKYKKIEMFHMPVDKVNKIGHSRYSTNGFPCLYLGSTLYVCWEELRRPNIEQVNYVKMTAIQDIPVISTLCPSRFKEEKDVKQFFIFALCSRIVKDDGDRFQIAYAFPEMLLNALIYKTTKNALNHPYAIKYLSSRYFYNDGKFKSKGLYYNYVLPIGGNIDNADHLDQDLKNAFTVSEPKALYINRVYGRMPKVGRCRPNEYANTIFNLLEKELEKGSKI